MKHEEGTLTGTNSTRLHYQAWTPDGQPAAVMAMVHGTPSIPSYQLTMARILSRLAPRFEMPLDNDHSHAMQDPEMMAVYEADPRRFRRGEYQEYPGALHELYNDFGWQEVVADVAGWLERQLSQRGSSSFPASTFESRTGSHMIREDSNAKIRSTQQAHSELRPIPKHRG